LTGAIFISILRCLSVRLVSGQWRLCEVGVLSFVFMLCIYSRQGTCLLFQQWHQQKKKSPKAIEQQKKLMCGLLFSMKAFVKKVTSKK
jgi:hypothetical protein